MVNQLVVLVNLEYEGVVDVVATEYLHSEACSEKDEADDCGEVVSVHTRINLTPIITSWSSAWSDTQEDEERSQHEQTTPKEWD